MSLDLSQYPPRKPGRHFVPSGSTTPKNPVWESMTRLTIGFQPHHYEVRVWRDEEAWSEGDNADLFDMASALADKVTRDSAVRLICETFGSMPRVAAVECLRGHSGRGAVYYPDWR